METCELWELLAAIDEVGYMLSTGAYSEQEAKSLRLVIDAAKAWLEANRGEA